MAILSESNWRLATEYEVAAGDMAAARTIVSGFAPNNLGPQNVQALKLNIGDVAGTSGDAISAAYTLDNDFGVLPSNSQYIQGWFNFDYVGVGLPPEAFCGLKMRVNQTDPADIPTGLWFAAYYVAPATVEIFSALVDQNGNVRDFQFNQTALGGSGALFYKIAFIENGPDLRYLIEFFDSNLQSLFAFGGDDATSPLVAFAGDVTFGTNGEKGAAGVGPKFDDIEIGTQSSIVLPPPPVVINYPIQIDFEGVSWQ